MDANKEITNRADKAGEAGATHTNTVLFSTSKTLHTEQCLHSFINISTVTLHGYLLLTDKISYYLQTLCS